MFPPIPAAFSGSLPEPDAVQAPMARLVQATFAALAVVAAGGAGLAALLLDRAPTWPMVTALACAALLVPALAGLLLARRLGEEPARIVARLVELTMAHAQTGGGAVARPPMAADGPRSLGALFGETILRLRRMQRGQERTQAAAGALNAALRAGRSEAELLAMRLRGDGSTVAEAASGILQASARLRADAVTAAADAALATDTVGGIAGRSATLAASVRAVTGQVRQMTEMAVAVSETAMGTQADLARLAGRAAALDGTAAQLRRALHLATACLRQAEALEPAGAAADLATNLRDMAAGAEEGLQAMGTVIAALRQEAAAASRRVAELCAVIQSQHELGGALGHAVDQQGQEIARTLAGLGAAYDTCSAVAAQVAAIGAGNEGNMAAAEVLRGAGDRLPAHAEVIARILRGIPDFAPPLDR